MDYNLHVILSEGAKILIFSIFLVNVKRKTAIHGRGPSMPTYMMVLKLSSLSRSEQKEYYHV